MSRLLKKKTAYIIIGLGVACLILGPFFGIILDKMTIFEAKPQIIQEDSTTSIRNSFAQPVTLAKDQKLIVEIAEFYQNSSVTIRIVTKSAYDQAYNLDIAPGGVTRLDFVYSEFGWGSSPAGSTFGADTLTLPTNGIYFYIEFMGGRVGDSLISWPGDYYVIVYGTNSGPPAITSVVFDITIKVDGPGETLNNLLLLIGIVILLVYVLAVLVSVLKANYLR